MKKIAILGIDNSHAWSFAKFLAPKEGEKVVEGFELLGVYGDYETEDGKKGKEEIEKIANCPCFAEHYNDFVEQADAVMVTARDGAKHLKFAEEYIKKGIPVWIDKPITRDTDEVCKMVELAKKHNCLLTGGSGLVHIPSVVEFKENLKTLKYPIGGGHVTAPVSFDNLYGGFWFYTQHLVQMMTFIFGNDVKAVRALREGNEVHAIYYYDDYTVSTYYGANYSITVYDDGAFTRTEAINLDGKFYTYEFKDFCELIETGKPNMTDADIIAPVYIIDATIKAYTEDKRIEIKMPF